ncbi:cytosolic carboxypeptidase-like protein 5 isoform X4 [Pieris brassicae]|uniref:cytosolic carboxypeptidase-like protein 5 isoform X4 n=1 Tax=Pieris brassicae TaxID=7116 RepID=UPI001E662999|nr:cytosolic carboxypeptidase-like protein 5 isoform X4 [Pieris brassicae]
MDRNKIIESGGFYFIHNFDSGNLGHVERVPTELISPTINLKTNTSETPDYEFNIWTRPDCAGTEFENGNRTWFYFGIQAAEPNVQVRLNIINLNKQGKMYNQGMAPVTRTLPGKPQWERIRDRPVHSTDDNTFTLSFKYRTSENPKATTFFAFTYPFSFAELQIALNSIDLKMLPLPLAQSPDEIYYYRECLIYSLEGRRVDLLTISSHHGITTEKEHRLKNLFPDNQERPYKFQNKKVIFMSARVHPGETPSSFVFNGFLNLLLTRNDPIAIQLRKLYVFKMIPFLNPDGVARGHYRTDTRGVNLNRVYLNPSLVHHPTVYASRSLIRYYHYGYEKEEDVFDDLKSIASRSIGNISESAEFIDTKKKKNPLKGSDYKREKTSSAKSLSRNKSSMTIKRASNEDSKDAQSLTGEASHLADQVHDMKLQEMPSQTNDESTAESINLEETSSLLNDNVLRSCLGSTVHLSTSEELKINGGNLLRPLRETLKNSISLLMESSTSVTGDSAEAKEARLANIKMGWCEECQRAVSRLEDTMPGIANMVPGYSAMILADTPKYTSIDEYREHQRQQVDAQERKLQDTENPGDGATVYFCTNCFKRYVISEYNEEIKLSEPLSCTSLGVSVCVGDSGDVCAALKPLPNTDDVIISETPKEKPKSPLKSIKKKPQPVPPTAVTKPVYKEPDSGLYLYIDLHGHASKKGIFMYGNHFEDVDSSVECMLLPRIMSLNNLHFHFSSCNFTERNMYLKDRRDGMSREGSGRVAVLKATGLVRSYTLECNYNTGRLVNVLPPAVRDTPLPTAPHAGMPPKYTPHIFEEVNPFQVGRSLGASILDLTGQHPNSRIPCSEHRTLTSLREWLRSHTRTMRPQLTMSRLRPKTASPTRLPLYARSKAKVTEERKENAYVGAKTDSERRRSPSVLAQRSGHEIVINMNMKYGKKNEPVKTPSRTRYLTENESKSKALSAKRRNVLAIRKPSTSKTQVGGVVKAKTNRRSADDAENNRSSVVSAKLSKRNYARSLRGAVTRSANHCRAMASSSSEDMISGTWEDVAGGTVLGSPSGMSHPDTMSMGSKRRSFPTPSPSRLKKIRLKTAL